MGKTSKIVVSRNDNVAPLDTDEAGKRVLVCHMCPLSGWADVRDSWGAGWIIETPATVALADVLRRGRRLTLHAVRLHILPLLHADVSVAHQVVADRHAAVRVRLHKGYRGDALGHRAEPHRVRIRGHVWKQKGVVMSLWGRTSG